MNTKLDLIVKLYTAAVRYAQTEAGVSRVLKVPTITRVGLIALDALMDYRPDIREGCNLVASRGLVIPPESRVWRVVSGLAKFVPGATNAVRSAEKWFSFSVVRTLAEASDGLATDAEAAGVIAAAIVMVGAKDQIENVAQRAGCQVPW